MCLEVSLFIPVSTVRKVQQPLVFAQSLQGIFPSIVSLDPYTKGVIITLILLIRKPRFRNQGACSRHTTSKFGFKALLPLGAHIPPLTSSTSSVTLYLLWSICGTRVSCDLDLKTLFESGCKAFGMEILLSSNWTQRAEGTRMKVACFVTLASCPAQQME